MKKEGKRLSRRRTLSDGLEAVMSKQRAGELSSTFKNEFFASFERGAFSKMPPLRDPEDDIV